MSVTVNRMWWMPPSSICPAIASSSQNRDFEGDHCVANLDLVDDLHPRGYFAEAAADSAAYDSSSISERDEEPGADHAGRARRHADHSAAPRGAVIANGLCELRTARRMSECVPALNQEAGDHPIEREAVIEVVH